MELSKAQKAHDEKLQDIREHPENHRHEDLNALNRCCFIEGAIDLSLMEAHSTYAAIGHNGGVACDVRSGPCSCGAWH